MKEVIESRLLETFKPNFLEVRDDSHLHKGHLGAKEGGHFHVVIVSELFLSKKVARHRQIYACLQDLMQNGVHALSIEAFLPQERPLRGLTEF